MDDTGYLRVGQLVKQGPRLRNFQPGTVLRIAKRKKRFRWAPIYEYFVVDAGGPAGYGCWVSRDQLRALTPLELLGLQVE